MITLAAILAYAQSQPAERTYDYIDGNTCPVASMLLAQGHRDVSVSPSYAEVDGNTIYFEVLAPMGEHDIDIDNILIGAGGPRNGASRFNWTQPGGTYGALVSRIQQYQASLS